MELPHTLKHALSFDIEYWFHIVRLTPWATSSGQRCAISKTARVGVLDALARPTCELLSYAGWSRRVHPMIATAIAGGTRSHAFLLARRVDQRIRTSGQDLRESIEVSRTERRKVLASRTQLPITPGSEWALRSSARHVYDASGPASRARRLPCPQTAPR